MRSGQDYLVQAGYPAEGMTWHAPAAGQPAQGNAGLLETMFSSHPMSTDRMARAQELARTQQCSSRSASAPARALHGSTASLRRIVRPSRPARTASWRWAARPRRGAGPVRPGAEGRPARLRCPSAHGPVPAGSRARPARRSAMSRPPAIYPQEAAQAVPRPASGPGRPVRPTPRWSSTTGPQADPGVLFRRPSRSTAWADRAAEHCARFPQISRQGEAAQFSRQPTESDGPCVVR